MEEKKETAWETRWYVMQVLSGKEGQTVAMAERILSKGILECCFVPIRRLKKKYHGSWQEVTEKLFPGYVFLVSSQPQKLYNELKKIPSLAKLLGNCEEYFTPLPDADVSLLLKMQCTPQIQDQNGEKHLREKTKKYSENTFGHISGNEQGKSLRGMPEAGLSKVVINGEGQVRVISGPLKNLEGQIKKFNLHKRIASVETEFMGTRTLIHLGIEIIENEYDKDKDAIENEA